MSDVPSQRVVLARHTTDSGEFQLQRRPMANGAPAYEIIANGVFLMASYNDTSARALTRLALERLRDSSRSGLRVLVGGLGMGFTLQEALVAEVAAVDVVESSSLIIDWNRRYFTELNGAVLNDPRVWLIEDDLYQVLSMSPPASYAAILLDVDNGPSWLAHDENKRLYTSEALAQWSGLLASGGVFAVWSAQPEPGFRERLQGVFGNAEEVRVLESDERREPVPYFIYLSLA